MYANDTILTLKEPRGPDPETGEEFPYNTVRVIGPSPINHGIHSGDWSGGQAAGVLIQPNTNFGANLDEPFGKLQALYDVHHIPETVVNPAATRQPLQNLNRVQQIGPTPEEVFREEAPGVAPEIGQARGRTVPTSPLDDPRPTVHASPLDVPVVPVAKVVKVKPKAPA